MDYQSIITEGESRTVEFKSDRGPLPDRDLMDTVVCLANGGGGQLFLGVEDDGTVTGLHVNHQAQPQLLAPFIASRTVPPLSVEVDLVELPVGEHRLPVAVVHIPASPQPIATTDGRLLLRYLDTQGAPGCRPLYPHELSSWQADRGLLDATARPVHTATWDDLDPLEFARLRRLIEENRGDAVLLELSDRELAHALQMITLHQEQVVPTIAGLLLLGKESALHHHLPAHEVAFQVLHGTDVAVNEFRRWPLLRIHEWLLQAIDVRNEERELMLQGVRIGVPRYDRRGIREAVHNALIHRDYQMLGAIHVQLHDDHVLTFGKTIACSRITDFVGSLGSAKHYPRRSSYRNSVGPSEHSRSTPTDGRSKTRHPCYLRAYRYLQTGTVDARYRRAHWRRTNHQNVLNRHAKEADTCLCATTWTNSTQASASNEWGK